MKKILIAYDGSNQSEKAFDLALDLAVKYRSKLTVLSVVQLSVPPEDQETEATIEYEENRFKELFIKLKEKAENFCSHKFDYEIRVGHPAEQIIYYADEHGIDHIVLGHRGHALFHRWLLGSVSKKVMNLASCPITIARV